MSFASGSYDKEIYAPLNISGHAIKHVLASGSALIVFLMIKKRQLINRQNGET